MSVTIDPYARLIRPWYPAGATGHIYVDCPDLLYWESAPSEGPGWLDPAGKNVCTRCRKRHDDDIAAAAPRSARDRSAA